MSKKSLFVLTAVVGLSCFIFGQHSDALTTSLSFVTSLKNSVPDNNAFGNSAIYFEQATNAILSYDLNNNLSTTVMATVIAPGQKVQKVLSSPDHSKLILEVQDPQTGQVRYLVNLDTKTKTSLPVLSDLMWGKNDELIEVYYGPQGQKLRVYSVSQNKLVKDYSIDALDFDRFLGYDSVNQTIYFTIKYIPSDYEPGTPLSDNVSVVALDENSGKKTTLKENISAVGVAFINNAIFYDAGDGVHMASATNTGGQVVYSSQQISFNVGDCDGLQDGLYCTTNTSGKIGLANIGLSTNELTSLSINRPIFMGRVRILSANPLILFIYDEFSGNITILSSKSPNPTPTTSIVPSVSPTPSGSSNFGLIALIILIIVAIAGLVVWFVIRNRRKKVEDISVNLPQ